MVTGWAATAIMAVRAGAFTPSRSMLITSYREQIGDDWLQLLEEIEDECHVVCNYLIPSDRAQRRRLRDIAARVLGFENHALSMFEPVISAALASPDQTKRRHAIGVLDDINFSGLATT